MTPCELTNFESISIASIQANQRSSPESYFSDSSQLKLSITIHRYFDAAAGALVGQIKDGPPTPLVFFPN